MTALAFKGKRGGGEKKNTAGLSGLPPQTQNTCPNPAHVPGPPSCGSSCWCASGDRTGKFMMTSAKRSISRARLPAIRRATRGHAAVEAVTDTRHWALSCVLFRTALVCRMVMEWLVAIKRRHHHKSPLARRRGNCIVGQFPPPPPHFLCEFVKLACCLRQIGRRTRGEKKYREKTN